MRGSSSPSFPVPTRENAMQSTQRKQFAALLALLILCFMSITLNTIEVRRDASAFINRETMVVSTAVTSASSEQRIQEQSPLNPRLLLSRENSIVSACVGSIPKWVEPRTVATWLKYYKERWGLTHADLFISAAHFDETRMAIEIARRRIDLTSTSSTTVNVTYSAIPTRFSGDGDRWEYENGHMVSKCLYDAKRRGSTFHFWFGGTNQYLVSDQYATIRDMFLFANQTAISFPVFESHNYVCSGHEPSFASATFRNAIPVGSQVVVGNDRVYNDPPERGDGTRRYIVQPEFFYHVDGLHVPDLEFEHVEFDFSGRATEQQDPKMIHFLTHGIRKYNDPKLCQHVIAPPPNNNWTECPFVNPVDKDLDSWKCSREPMQESVQFAPTALNEILSNTPLSISAINRYRNAVCYAKRYPSLAQKYCRENADGFDWSSCDGQSLRNHFATKGGRSGFVYGCEDPSRLEIDPASTIVSACVGALDGQSSVKGIAGWMKYYQERWGLTHADVFLGEPNQNERIQRELQAAFEETNITVKVTFAFVPDEFATGGPRWEYENGHMISKCLYDAKRRGSSFHFWIGTNQYLVSKQFSTLQDMFETTNHTAISFPVFVVRNHICTFREPSFGAATYRTVVPVGSELSEDPSLVYTDPPPREEGTRRYIVMPEFHHLLDGVHVPEIEFFPELDFTGRAIDNQDAKLLDFVASDRMQSFAPDLEVCSFVPSEKNLTDGCHYAFKGGDTWNCSSTIDANIETLVHDPTEVNEILNIFPLLGPSMDLHRDAVCYANRYPNLRTKYCYGNSTKTCNHQYLAGHFEWTGLKQKRVWGCGFDPGKLPETIIQRQKELSAIEDKANATSLSYQVNMNSKAAVYVNNTNETLEMNKGGLIVSACIGALHRITYPSGVAAWIKFHKERWGLTHADMFLFGNDFKRLSVEIDNALEKMSVTVVTSYASIPEEYRVMHSRWDYENGHMINKCLFDAKQRGSHFHFFMSSSQFLVSRQYTSLQELFDATNNSVVSFPVFNVSSEVCSQRQPTFDAATYRSVLSVGRTVDPSKHVSEVGQLSDIGERTPHLVIPKLRNFVVDTVPKQEMKFDFGRAIDDQSTRVFDLIRSDKMKKRDRTICQFAPTNQTGCRYVHPYEYQGTEELIVPNEKRHCSSQMSSEQPEAASFVHDPTEMNEILTGIPLSPMPMETYKESQCYAMRYPDLATKYCRNGTLTNCDPQSLARHFRDLGKEQSRTFGCSSLII